MRTVAVGLLLVLPLVAHGAPLDLADLAVPHPPIRIRGDADFALPTSGVVGGDGSASDPYRIAGWFIVPASDGLLHLAGIEIRATTKHVVIEGNTFARGIGPAIIVKDAQNVRISANRAVQTTSGIFVGDSQSVEVFGNEIAEMQQTVTLLRSRDVTVAGNDVACTGVLGGVIVAASERVRVEGNTVACPDGFGVEVNAGSREVAVVGNTLSGAAGLSVEDVSDILVAENVVSRGGGMQLTGVSGIRIVDNAISQTHGPGLSIHLDETSQAGGLVEGNTVSEAGTPFNLEGFPLPYPVQFRDNWMGPRPLTVLVGARDSVLDGTGQAAAFLALIDAYNVTIANWTIASEAAYPLQVIGGEDVLVEGNHVGPGKGMRSRFTTGLMVRQNTFDGVSRRALDLASPGARIEGNVFSGGWVELSSVTAHAPSRPPATADGSVVSRNVISCPERGLVVQWVSGVLLEGNVFGDGGVRAPDASGLVVRGNAFRGGNIAGDGNPESPIDARWNWWGSPAGPEPDNGAQSDIMYRPWLVAPP